MKTPRLIVNSTVCTKLVPVRQLALGMTVVDIRRPWWDHQFLRSEVHVDSAEVLAKFEALGPDHLVEVQVDDGQPAVPPPAAPASPALQPEPHRTPSAATTSSASSARPLALESEMERARRVVARAKAAISQAMADGRTGEIRNLSEVRDIAEDMVASTARNPGALHSLVLLKTADDYTFTHCVAVGAFMISLGRTLGLSELALRHAGTAGLLHDVGKAGIDEKVLNKPGKLTDEEYSHIKLHPVAGEQLLRDSGYSDEESLDVVRHHHERMDGRGYPDGLNHQQISQLARMGAVADVYDAVTSNRSYHKAMAPTAGLQLLLKLAQEGHFDPAVVNAFVRTVGLYPNGSLVRLRSDKLAVVKEQSSGSLKMPVVRVFYSLKSNLPLVPYDVRLETSQDSIVSFVTAETYGISAHHAQDVLGLRG